MRRIVPCGGAGVLNEIAARLLSGTGRGGALRLRSRGGR